MPEMLEAEAARALIEARALHRPIERITAKDRWYLKRHTTAAALRAALVGESFSTARRIGKQILVDVAPDGPTLGLHLGMSGRVIIDDQAAGDPLVYASNKNDPAWHRFTVHFADGGYLALRDPRRLGGVELEPDETRLGPDAASIDARDLARVLASAAPVKATLMNQARIAGLGNLLSDEALWRAGIAPTRAADSLDAAERASLLRAVRSTIRTLSRRGGSHTGDLTREPDGVCPRDGTPLARATVGGRTTYWCPHHQH